MAVPPYTGLLYDYTGGQAIPLHEVVGIPGLAANFAAPGVVPQPRKSKYRGVTWDRRDQRWRVRINCMGVQHHVGRYFDETEAACVYDKVSYLLYGDDAITNFGVQAAAANCNISIPANMLQLHARYKRWQESQKAAAVAGPPLQFVQLQAPSAAAYTAEPTGAGSSSGSALPGPHAALTTNHHLEPVVPGGQLLMMPALPAGTTLLPMPSPSTATYAVHSLASSQLLLRAPSADGSNSKSHTAVTFSLTAPLSAPLHSVQDLCSAPLDAQLACGSPSPAPSAVGDQQLLWDRPQLQAQGSNYIPTTSSPEFLGHTQQQVLSQQQGMLLMQQQQQDEQESLEVQMAKLQLAAGGQAGFKPAMMGATNSNPLPGVGQQHFIQWGPYIAARPAAGGAMMPAYQYVYPHPHHPHQRPAQVLLPPPPQQHPDLLLVHPDAAAAGRAVSMGSALVPSSIGLSAMPYGVQGMAAGPFPEGLMYQE